MFDWDEANLGHIAEHDVEAHEAEEVVTNMPLDVSYEYVEDELRFRQIGETSFGRILVVVSTERRGLTRVVTAYEPSRLLRAGYLKYKARPQHGKEDLT